MGSLLTELSFVYKSCRVVGRVNELVKLLFSFVDSTKSSSLNELLSTIKGLVLIEFSTVDCWIVFIKLPLSWKWLLFLIEEVDSESKFVSRKVSKRGSVFCRKKRLELTLLVLSVRKSVRLGETLKEEGLLFNDKLLTCVDVWLEVKRLFIWK